MLYPNYQPPRNRLPSDTSPSSNVAPTPSAHTRALVFSASSYAPSPSTHCTPSSWPACTKTPPSSTSAAALPKTSASSPTTAPPRPTTKPSTSTLASSTWPKRYSKIKSACRRPFWAPTSSIKITGRGQRWRGRRTLFTGPASFICSGWLNKSTLPSSYPAEWDLYQRVWCWGCSWRQEENRNIYQW